LPLAARNVDLVPLAREYRGFYDDLGSVAPEMPQNGIQLSYLPANSLLTRTGKSLAACTELEQVIREIIRPIKEFGFRTDSGSFRGSKDAIYRP
jgi:hypothetical protein